MTAEEMFKQLGYEFEKEYTSDGVNDTYRYNKCFRGDSIIFDLNGKNIIVSKIFHTISLNELQAIIQQSIELGWLEEEKQETKQETNLDHYKNEILEECLENLAVVKGRPKLCNKTNCNDCDFKINLKGCHKKVRDWLKQPHIKQTYKITKFEKDLLQCYSSGHKFEVFNSLIGMKEKGYFKDIDLDLTIDDILSNCEVIKNAES